MPGPRTPFPAPPPQVVGHRGAPLVHPENTPGAFAAAYAAGARWVELDARRTADGDAVVHHDPHLADGRALVEMTADELAAEGVHRLADVLAGLPAGLGIDLEVKHFPGEPDHDEEMAVLAACVAAVASTPPRPAVLTAFNPMLLLAAAPAGWTHPIGLLTIGAALHAGIEVASELGCALLCPHDTTEGLDADGIAAVHAEGLQVMVWTVDLPARVQGLAAAGVDAICTNDPALVLGTLEGLHVAEAVEVGEVSAGRPAQPAR